MSEGPASTPDSDVYTVLLIIGTILVATGTVFLCMRSQELFGTWNPFTAI